MPVKLAVVLVIFSAAMHVVMLGAWVHWDHWDHDLMWLIQ
jgi:hypothetical protein